MRKAILAAISVAYLCFALAVAALVWRAGSGWGAALAALFGSLGFLIAVHGVVARAIDMFRVKGELSQLRNAHRLLVDQLEKTQGDLDILAEQVRIESAQRVETLSSEVRMLEDLVERMTDDLEARLSAAHTSGFGRALPSQTAALLETVREALAQNRVDLYLQPVVTLPQRRVTFYESFSRLRDETGRVLMPAEYLSVAEPEGLVPAIDNLLLFRCVQIVRRLAKNDRRVGIFCNVSLASLSDEAFFPQFLDFLAKNRDLSGALIFELGQDAFNERGAVEARNMAKLADLGFRFSIDKVKDLDLDFADLSRADVKFVKIGAQVLLDQLLEVEGRLALKSMKDLQAGDFAALTRRYGVEVIAEKIEVERQVIDVLELDIGYGQGHLFGEPRAIKEAVLAETDPPAGFMRPNLQRRVAGR
jgi:cyclic-di-GMP phosphodiesterase TipF (flagellum assembly factor)